MVYAYLVQTEIVLSVDPVMHVAGINAREASAVEGLILENHVTFHHPTGNAFITFSFTDSQCLFALGFSVDVLFSIYKLAFFFVLPVLH